MRHRRRTIRFEQLEPRFAPAAGALDIGFGAGGLVEESFPHDSAPSDTFAEAMLDAKGRIVVAANTVNGHGRVGAVARYDDQGNLDPSFGMNGTATIVFSGNMTTLSDMATQPDGKVVVVGSGAKVASNPSSQAVMTRLNADGSIDESFGEAGLVKMPYPVFMHFSAVALTPNGQIVTVRHYLGGEIVINRFEANGDIDRSFGNLGTTSLFHERGQAHDLTLLNDGSIVLLASTKIDSEAKNASDVILTKFSADGSRDSEFGTNGEVRVPVIRSDLSSNYYKNARLAVDADGDILLLAARVNSSLIGEVYDMIIMKMDAEGVVDQDFGNAGQVAFSFGPDSITSPIGLHLAPDGSILVAGLGTHFFSARLNSNGTFSKGYGNGGLQELSIGLPYTTYSGGGALLPLSENRTAVVLSGAEYSWKATDVVLIGLDAEGYLDASFGIDGEVYSNLISTRSHTETNDVLGLPGGHILALVSDYVQPGTFLARYRSDGSLDPKFGTNGRQVLPVKTINTYYSLKPRFLRGSAANSVLIDTGQSIEMARLSDNGIVLDDAGANGWVSFPYSDRLDYAFAASLKPDGGLLLVGSHGDAATQKSEYRFISFRSDGALDESFGELGIADAPRTWGLGGAGASVCFQSDGSLVALLGNAAESTFAISLLRLLPDGMTDTSFGEQGFVTVPLRTGHSTDKYRQLLCDANDRLVISGTTTFDNFLSLARVSLARFTAQGELDSSFGESGLAELRLHLTSDEPRFLTMDSQGRIVLAAVSHDLFHYESAVIRFDQDGHPDQSFGDGGIATFHLNTYSDAITSLDFEPGGSNIIAGGWLKDGIETRNTILRIVGEQSVWQNRDDFMDANDDGVVSPIDALVIINDMNTNGSRQLPSLYSHLSPKVDVNGDGYLSPLDALIVVNHLNSVAWGEGAAIQPSLHNPVTPHSDMRGARTTVYSPSMISVRDQVFSDLVISDELMVVASQDAAVSRLYRRILFRYVPSLLDLESLSLEAISKGD